MNRKGFAAPVVLLVIFLLLVAGAIAWVHYYYLPHMASEDTGSTPPPPASSAVSAAQTSTTPTAPSNPPLTTTPTTKTENNTNLVSCANNDLSCLIAAAGTCAPASVEWSSNLSILGALIQTTKSNLALGGMVSGKCAFSDRVDGVSLAFPSSTVAQAEAQGMTAAQIQEQLQQSDAQAQQSVGITTKCTFTTSYLTQMLTNWSEGNLSSNDLNAANCTATGANGKSIQISGVVGSG